jgi:hypothetical protein
MENDVPIIGQNREPFDAHMNWLEGKTIAKDVPTQKAQVILEKGVNSWTLLVVGSDGQVGAAAFGPIGSLPLIQQILGQSGAKPHVLTKPHVLNGEY